MFVRIFFAGTFAAGVALLLVLLMG